MSALFLIKILVQRGMFKPKKREILQKNLICLIFLSKMHNIITQQLNIFKIHCIFRFLFVLVAPILQTCTSLFKKRFFTFFSYKTYSISHNSVSFSQFFFFSSENFMDMEPRVSLSLAYIKKKCVAKTYPVSHNVIYFYEKKNNFGLFSFQEISWIVVLA